MAFYFLAGELANVLGRGVTAPVASPAANALWPETNLRDNRSALPMIFDTAANDSTISLDLNYLTNGTFETDVTGWTMLGTGTIAQSNTHAHTGTYAALLTAVTSEAIAYQDVTVRAGESLILEGWAYGADDYIRIRNRQTGKYLTNAAAWAASGAAITGGAGAWAGGPLAFTVEDWDTCKRDTVTLRIYLDSTGGTPGWFDDVALYPACDWVSIHGHNIAPAIVPTIQTSDDNSTWNTEATMTVLQDSFYKRLSAPVAHRYWRILFDGQPDTDSLMGMGELVIGASDTLDVNPLYPGTLATVEKQTRLETAAGSQFIYLHNGQPLRSLSMPFAYRTDAQYEQAYRDLFRGSRGGSNLICIAPVEMDAKVVILGRITESASFPKTDYWSRSGEFQVVEDALPNLVRTHVYDAPIAESGA